MTAQLLDRQLPEPALAAALPHRAAAAARPSPASPGEFLSFRIGDEEYALGILHVQEIRSYEVPTRMAGAPGCVKGVVNLRGVIVPIVDLRLMLGVGDPCYDAFTSVIVLSMRQRVIGLVVDSVCDVVELSGAQIRPPPQLKVSDAPEFISGIASLSPPPGGNPGLHKRMLILVDVEPLLDGRSTGLIDTDDALP